MHIIFEDQKTNAKTIACLDRDSGKCRLLLIQPEHLGRMIKVLKVLGVEEIELPLDVEEADWPTLRELTYRVVQTK